VGSVQVQADPDRPADCDQAELGAVALQAHDIEIVLRSKAGITGTGHHARHGCYWNSLRKFSYHGGESVLDVGQGAVFWRWSRCGWGGLGLRVEANLLRWIGRTRTYATENGFGDNLEFRCGTLEEVDRQGELRPDLVLRQIRSPDACCFCAMIGAVREPRWRGSCCPAFCLIKSKEIVEAFSKSAPCCLNGREQDGWVGLELLMWNMRRSKCVTEDRTTTLSPPCTD